MMERKVKQSNAEKFEIKKRKAMYNQPKNVILQRTKHSVDFIRNLLSASTLL